MLQVYINGALVGADEARISPLAGGFLHGVGLFETLRAYGGRHLFRLEAHLDRLFRSAAVIKLHIQHTGSGLTSAIYETLAANALRRDAHVRLTVAQGPEASQTVLITVYPLTAYPEMSYLRGAHAVVAETRRSVTSLLARIKSLNYLENLTIRREAQALDVDEAIFLDTDGYLAEGAASNLFWVKSGVIYTPALDRPILPGVTRSVVIGLAAEAGFGVSEGRWPVACLLEADEAFLTNSLMEVMPLTRVDQTEVGSGVPDAITTTLMGLYRDEVNRVSCDRRRNG